MSKRAYGEINEATIRALCAYVDLVGSPGKSDPMLLMAMVAYATHPIIQKERERRSQKRVALLPVIGFGARHA